MKMLSIILSLYLVLLGFMPCADLEQEHSEGSNIEMADHKDQHSDHPDLCTPFCSCSCCGASIAFFDIKVEMPFIGSIPIDRAFPHLETSLLNNTNSFWQPPKI